ncbi:MULTISPECIES: RHS repeat-associated core domain-containing protein [Pseudomonas]|uniref:RHS repeat-associated core domain-containing protein n=1 Tax=Pseudomonas aphyarum TaxID=2942629 RepID=A0ABT5PIX5_9PSED|nr:RHS repeat-associated core domain-containing protein [Pseudomonas aphyarum]MDD0970762.1 RHS repeat-associated core domain-containing protein [Pseudomonas aphyarum]MDD1123838.1 RHS repeat-associated core domain-containing protein [Pseudomonas aphyarum]
MNASVHGCTPSVAVSGPRGEAIRQIEYLRSVVGEQAQALIHRQRYDVAGHPVAQRDPRLATPNTTTVHRLDGMVVRTRNVDGGQNTVLPGLGGELLQSWDTNGNHREMTYDPQLRPQEVTENGVTGFETFSYDNASADPTFNRRGQMKVLSDPSGTLQSNSFGMKGQTLEETRSFKDGKICTSRQRFSAVGALLETTDAGGHVQQSAYDVAGQLVQVQLQLSGQTFQDILNGADYNAATQITEQRLGNGVVSRWHYREADGRLLRQYAQKASEPAIQDFEYDYDRVGNITRIIDHTYTPTFFRNQRVDGERTFAYDSIYRLIRATGHSDAPPADNSGRPQPTDPNDRRNYVETFEYDDGNNLKKLTHIRDGNTYTREMFIDPASNRGVRWGEGDPAPDFNTLFDRAGNLLALQPGQPMDWNSRNQLQSLILAEHESGPPDQELYHYSQGARVYKRHETHTSKVSHVDEVHYVRSLEIRTKSSGEELHRITVVTGVGEVTCLHWRAGKPPAIDDNQLRYSLTDHLGSNVKKLDQQTRLISDESYYAFGGTASMAARSQIEADYKFTRYSGKEMDVTGLYYYGNRYYAPWLCRWVSADPAGDADGLNRYAFVGNNPLSYVDPSGGTRAEAAIMLYAGFVSQVAGNAEYTLDRLHNIIQQKGLKRSLFANLTVEGLKGGIGYEAGLIGGGQIDMAMPGFPATTPYTTPGGLIGGNIGGDVSGAMADVPLKSMPFHLGPLIPQTSQLSVAAIDSNLGITDAVKEIGSWSDFKNEVMHPALDSVFNPDFLMNRVMASWISIIPATLSMFARAIEGEDIKNRLDPVKIQKIEDMLNGWQAALEERSAWVENAFDAFGKDVLYPADLLPNVNMTTTKETLAPISRAGLRQQTRAVMADIAHAQRGLAAYREMGTTDNQFLRRQAHPRK